MKFSVPFLVIGCIALTGCFASYKLGSYYHPRDRAHGLGYSETRVSPNVWRVTYRGFYIPESQSFDYALLRAADTVKAAGFPYFVVESERSSSTNQAGMGLATGGLNMVVGGAVTGGYPEANLLVRGLTSRSSSSSSIVYDAAFISAEIRRKYKITESAQ